MTTEIPFGFHLSEDDCLDLLSNALAPPERAQLVQHIRSCTACESMLKERDADWERLLIQSGPAIRQLDQQGSRGGWLKGWVPRATRPFSLPLPRLSWLAAVGLLLVITVGFVMRAREEKQQAFLSELRWLPPLPEEVILRRGERTGGLEMLRGGLDAYSRKDPSAAIEGFASIQVPAESEPLRRAYLGSALAWAGRYSEAVTQLQRLDPTRIPDPWSTEVRWTLMIALRETGQRARADSLLRALAEEPGESGRRAKALLTRTR